MQAFICLQCGTQYDPSSAPPPSCPVCEDARQYIRYAGQAWTTPEQLMRDFRALCEDDDGAPAFVMDPHFAIGQRALLHRSPHGNILWDCIALLNDDIVARIKALGGLSAIAISHPHYYSNMAEWSEAFDAPVYIHEAERGWARRSFVKLNFWSGETLALDGDATLIRCGGHYEGGMVMHAKSAADGAGAIFAGDILQVAADRAYVSFMWSYPNNVPLGPKALDRIEAALAPFAFERIYGAFLNRNVVKDGKAALARSLARYRAALRDEYPG